MNIVYSKGYVDIEYKGKKARFYGDLGLVGFRAFANTMKWLLPKKDAPVSQEERDEWINVINNHFMNTRDRVIFVDDNGNELKKGI